MEKTKTKEDETSTDESQALSWSDFSRDVPEEMLVMILSHLTPREVFTIRATSQRWSDFTREEFFLSKHMRQCTLTGFFYQEPPSSSYYPGYNYPNQPIFISTEPESISQLPDPHFNFLKKKNVISQIQVIDSCNGLLLCSGSTVGRFGLVKTWFVCNPVTKEKCLLPYPCKLSVKPNYALVADLTTSSDSTVISPYPHTGYLRFKVLCLFEIKEGTPHSRLSIFSSETWEWEEFEECLPPLCDKRVMGVMGSKIYFKGRLLWDSFDNHILITYITPNKEKRRYELLEAPQAPLGRCLWTVEDNIYCYCNGFSYEYQTWSIRLDDVNNIHKWEVENCQVFKNLNEDIRSGSVMIKMELSSVRFKIITYVPESDKFFFLFAGSICSYGVKDRSVNFLWGKHWNSKEWTEFLDLSKFNQKCRIIPFSHCIAPMQCRLNFVQEDNYWINRRNKKKNKTVIELINEPETETRDDLVINQTETETETRDDLVEEDLSKNFLD